MIDFRIRKYKLKYTTGKSGKKIAEWYSGFVQPTGHKDKQKHQHRVRQSLKRDLRQWHEDGYILHEQGYYRKMYHIIYYW